jgi:carbon storage regulator
MLVLQRKQDERILVGDNIWITIVQINGGNVRVGIDAPDDVAIRRAELVARDLALATHTDPQPRRPHQPTHAISSHPPIRRAGR